jgi:3'-5' exoribonuclease
MIISHHGELEFGSPKVPIFAEALLLHHLDNLDSKMDAIRGALLKDQQVDGEFTGWIGPLERVLLKKERYLEGPKAPAPKPLPAPPTVLPEPLAAKPESAHRAPAPPPIPVSHPQPAQPLPAQPLLVPAAAQPKPEYRQPQNTLFADKLQAVLETRK